MRGEGEVETWPVQKAQGGVRKAWDVCGTEMKQKVSPLTLEDYVCGTRWKNSSLSFVADPRATSLPSQMITWVTANDFFFFL